MREVLSDPWAFWMGHKHSSSVQTTKGAELGCLWLKTSRAAPAGRDKTIQAASIARISPVAQQCFGEAQCSFTPTPQPWMLSGLCPNHSKEQTRLHKHFSNWQSLFWETSVEGSPPSSLWVFFSLDLDCFAWWPKLHGQDYAGNDAFSSPAWGGNHKHRKMNCRSAGEGKKWKTHREGTKDMTHNLLYCKKSKLFSLGYVHMSITQGAFTPVPFSQQPPCLQAPQLNFFYLVRPQHKVSHRMFYTFSGSSSKLCNVSGHKNYSSAVFPGLLRGYGV